MVVDRITFCLLVSYIFIVRSQNGVPPDIIDSNMKPNVTHYEFHHMNDNISETEFLINVGTVVGFLSDSTPADGYATCLGHGHYPNDVYAHSGCYNNSDKSMCRPCLLYAYEVIQRDFNFSHASAARLWLNTTEYRCSLRYQNSNFTEEYAVGGTMGILVPNTSNPIQGGSSLQTGVIVGATMGGTCLILVIFIIFLFLIFRRRKAHRSRFHGHETLEIGFEGPMVFSYHDLCVATNYFSDENKLGQGGFGAVYKAVLANGSQVAVKKLSMHSQQGKKEFVNEINIITNIQHRNLARLKGYCLEGDERLLVYEFLENGSLDGALFNKTAQELDWKTRFQIVIDVARGLAYLHEESYIQIIHRDIKASNILLDENLQPKISDFGISKLFGNIVAPIGPLNSRGMAQATSTIAGTIGYLAPEYATYGVLTPKADVFSFGVFVLEIVSGRKSISTLPHEEEFLVYKAWSLYKSGKLEELVDNRLGSNYEWEQVYRVICVALLCTQDCEEDRPKMSDVITMLLGYVQLGPLPHEAPEYYGHMLTTAASTSICAGSRTEPLSTYTQNSVTLLDPR